MTGINRRSILSRHVARVYDVLYVEGHANQRSVGACTVTRLRFLYRLLRIHVLPRLNLRIALGYALETGASDRFARCLARADGSDDFGCGKFV
jgi:hypothetical protein